MKEIIRNPDRMYKLLENDGEMVLVVVCGGIGMFEMKVVLTEEEKRKFRDEGEAFLNDLALNISRNHSQYLDRTLN